MQWLRALTEQLLGCVLSIMVNGDHSSCCRPCWWWIYCRLAAGSRPQVSATMLATAAASSCCTLEQVPQKCTHLSVSHQADKANVGRTTVMHQKLLLRHTSICVYSGGKTKSLAPVEGLLASIITTKISRENCATLWAFFSFQYWMTLLITYFVHNITVCAIMGLTLFFEVRQLDLCMQTHSDLYWLASYG